MDQQFSLGRQFLQQLSHIKSAGPHVQISILGQGPFGFGAIPRQLDTILVRITQI
jgi:hypothetical protein